MESMRLGVEEAACNILENLQKHLRPGAIEYECFGEVHYFYIRYCGARFTVRFPEHALVGKCVSGVQPMIEELIYHVVNSAARSSLKTFDSMVVLSFSESYKAPSAYHQA